MKPTIGRIVHYVLSEQDAVQINRRRTTGDSIRDRIAVNQWPEGAQAHIGTDVQAGDHVAAVVVQAYGRDSASLQCLLDGSDNFHAQNRLEGTEPGTWHWPERE